MTITVPSPAGGSVPGGRHAFRAGDSPAGSGARPFPHVPGVTHRFVEVRGARLHVAEAGDGDPVVLLHGFPEHWYAWRRVVPLLAGRYRLVIRTGGASAGRRRRRGAMTPRAGPPTSSPCWTPSGCAGRG